VVNRNGAPTDPSCGIDERRAWARRALQTIRSCLESPCELPRVDLGVPRLDLLAAVEMDGRRAFLAAMSALDDLIDIQRDVMVLRFLGITNERIGRRLGVSLSDVKYHLNEAVRKLGAESRHQLNVLAYFIAGREIHRKDPGSPLNGPVTDPDTHRERAMAAVRRMDSNLSGGKKLDGAGVPVPRLDRLAAVDDECGTVYLVVMDSIEDLSARQRDILILRFRGVLYKQIPASLETTEPNVEYHLSASTRKLRAKRRCHLDAIGYFLAGWNAWNSA